MPPMEQRFRRLWLWSQDGAPVWFIAWVGEYMWRPWCWARGYHRPHHCDAYFEICVWCRALLWSKRRDGSPNPFIRGGAYIDHAPVTWRRWLVRAA